MSKQLPGPLIVVVGETASGKSGLAIKIAKKWDGEIISADSRTIYRGMDIGTAKPTPSEMEGIPHYGFDLVEPNQRFSAAQFKDYAMTKISDILSRGKTPILVGGTGLYVDGVLFNYSFGGKVDEKQRGRLNNKTVDELATLANRMGIVASPELLKNKRHLIRLIERNGETQNTSELFYNALITGINVPKNKLRERIESRTEKMFRMGLRKEYNDLREKFDVNSEAFTGIGYKEFSDWESGNTSMSEVKRHIVKNTMGLAKKQRTWFKRNPYIEWVDSEAAALELVSDFMDNK